MKEVQLKIFYFTSIAKQKLVFLSGISLDLTSQNRISFSCVTTFIHSPYRLVSASQDRGKAVICVLVYNECCISIMMY